MTETFLRADDLTEIAQHGLTVEEVRRQIELLRHPPPYAKLERPCQPGDGIRVLDADEERACVTAFDAARARGRFLKFVPASGAATRMFQSLLAAREAGGEIGRAQLKRRAETGDVVARDVLAWIDRLAGFAFYDDLKTAMARRSPALEACIERGEYRPILDALLTQAGLDYAALPKGVLKFHRYPAGSRTAFEEHLVEAAAHVRDDRGVCRLHFTVSTPHLRRFEDLLAAVRPAYEAQYAARFEVGFSTQHSRTDTVALGLDDEPFRDATDRLLFRPGGHGALIENLNELRGDLIFIKNIDNVLPDDRKGPGLRWKQVLGGHLVQRQQEIFGHLERLHGAPSSAALSDALRFAREVLSLELPAQVNSADADAVRDFLMATLDRPLRVCGMVLADDNPGGGPFWVRAADGTSTPQIVETAQVDPEAADQQAVLRSATHFNPVDIVCGVLNWRDEPFELHRYIDPAAVFITRKSNGGRPLKALEHPGLWNGAMAHWNTIFIEVPATTFRPVKTICDLLD